MSRAARNPEVNAYKHRQRTMRHYPLSTVDTETVDEAITIDAR